MDLMSCWEKMKGAKGGRVRSKKKEKKEKTCCTKSESKKTPIHCSKAENKQHDTVWREKRDGYRRDILFLVYFVHTYLNNM